MRLDCRSSCIRKDVPLVRFLLIPRSASRFMEILDRAIEDKEVPRHKAYDKWCKVRPSCFPALP